MSSFIAESFSEQSSSRPDPVCTLRTKTTLCEDLFRMQWEMPGHTDAVLIFANGVQVKLHSIILCATSNKWRNIFEQEHSLDMYREGHLQIPVPEEISLEVAVKVLHMIYLGEVLLAEDDVTDFQDPLEWFGIDKKEIIEVTRFFRPMEFIREQISKFQKLHVRYTKDGEDSVMGSDGTSTVLPDDWEDTGYDKIRLFCMNCGAVCSTMTDIRNHPKVTACPATANLKLLDESRYVTFTCRVCERFFVDLLANRKRSSRKSIPQPHLSHPVTESPMVLRQANRPSAHFSKVIASQVGHFLCIHCQYKDRLVTRPQMDPKDCNQEEFQSDPMPATGEENNEKAPPVSRSEDSSPVIQPTELAPEARGASIKGVNKPSTGFRIRQSTKPAMSQGKPSPKRRYEAKKKSVVEVTKPAKTSVGINAAKATAPSKKDPGAAATAAKKPKATNKPTKAPTNTAFK